MIPKDMKYNLHYGEWVAHASPEFTLNLPSIDEHCRAQL